MTKFLQLENKLLWFEKNVLDYRDAEIKTQVGPYPVEVRICVCVFSPFDFYQFLLWPECQLWFWDESF